MTHNVIPLVALMVALYAPLAVNAETIALKVSHGTLTETKGFAAALTKSQGLDVGMTMSLTVTNPSNTEIVTLDLFDVACSYTEAGSVLLQDCGRSSKVVVVDAHGNDLNAGFTYQGDPVLYPGQSITLDVTSREAVSDTFAVSFQGQTVVGHVVR